MIYQTLAISMLAATVSAELSSAPAQNLKLMWEAFKKDHRKSYATMEEESNRFSAFVQNLKHIDERNAAEKKAHGSAVHGITRFSDLTPEEFKARYLTYTKGEKTNVSSAKVAPYKGTEELVDWSGVYTTPVKDQGYCGSCWAFAASEQIESDAMRELSVTYTLSPQQLVECDRTSMGCNGGLQERAYNYVKRAGGIETESDYPYISGEDGSADSCHSESNKFVLTVGGYETITDGEAAMADYIKSTGPLSIAIDATTWSTYTGGVMSTCGDSINHAVQLVGVDTGAGYWKVRNSWSDSWGENGYIRLAYGEDMCGITYDVTYTTGVKQV